MTDNENYWREIANDLESRIADALCGVALVKAALDHESTRQLDDNELLFGCMSALDGVHARLNGKSNAETKATDKTVCALALSLGIGESDVMDLAIEAFCRYGIADALGGATCGAESYLGIIEASSHGGGIEDAINHHVQSCAALVAE